MWCNIWVVLLFVSILTLIGCVIAVYSLVMNKREILRRVGRQFTRCKFGSGTNFEVVEKHISDKTPQKPNLLFSISLFGCPQDSTFQKRYVEGLMTLVQRKQTLWPNSAVRVYVTKAVFEHIRDLVHGVDMYVVSPDPHAFEATMWRFWAVDDAECPVICMDADFEESIYNDSYAKMIEAWLASEKAFMVKRHFWFKALPMTAGRWGAKPGAFRHLFGPTFSMKQLTQTYTDGSFGVDEGFLNREIWPHIEECTYSGSVHSEEYAWLGILSGVTLAIGIIVYLAACGTRY